jgi:choline dehydrogenase
LTARVADPDYIVIGAGSSGAVIAARLSEHATVLLLEAGGPSRNLLYQMPAALTKLWFNPRSSWSLFTEPETALDGRRVPVPRGKAMGGSSAINGMVYNRGSAFDYDSWAANGLGAEWSFAGLMPYFRKIEDHWAGTSPWHGAGGPVRISPHSDVNPLYPKALAAAQAMGFAETLDFAGAQPEGFGTPEFTIDRRGRRVSAADAYLRPARGRANLRVEMNARVTRIIIEQCRAVGVDYLQHGKRQTVRAGREVILCGGAIASPQLLLLSGVGPADELRGIGIDPVHDLPAVGRDLQDQPACSFEAEALQPAMFERTLRADRFALATFQWALGLGGPLASPPLLISAIIRTTPGLAAPDMRVMLGSVAFDSRVWFPGLRKGKGHITTAAFSLCYPKSRGSLTLGSADPFAAPRIRYNLLAEGEDLTEMRRGYRLMRDLQRQDALREVIGAVTRPAREPVSDDEVDAFLRASVATTSHPLGSCRMGADEGSVVDSQFRVRGIKGLRVADASTFPTQIAGNPNGPIMAIGEKAADIILGKPAPPLLRGRGWQTGSL